MKAKLKLILILLFFILAETRVLADTISLKDGKEIKGIVVEEYNDRLVVSTYKGEKAIFKELVSKVRYDLPEQNLVKLGDAYTSRREYDKAYFYYEKAHKANPDYTPAREKMNYVMGYIFRKEEEAKRDDVTRMQEFENWPPETSGEEKDFEKSLTGDIGIRLAEKGNQILVTDVLKDSPAASAGLKENDILISVWGKFTGYMPRGKVAQLLLEEAAGEIKINIDRSIALKKERSPSRNYKEIMGGALGMLIDGLTVLGVNKGGSAEKAGLEKDDLIIAIDGAATRYMPLDDAIKMIKDGKKDVMTFTVRRNVTIWRK
ncbi:MAG: PDZ domain-containing protein [Candidatus Omnitrophica bacterium]|nr:PDZ domain-containing protein [Candidatus Omnitrophota bacterium]